MSHTHDEANSIADELIVQVAEREAAYKSVLGDRRQACGMLATLFDRFSCAACGAGQYQTDCPCGFAEVGKFLDRPDIVSDLDEAMWGHP